MEKLSQQLAYGMHDYKCATAWQKAMGEALFDTVLAKLRKSGIPKGPLVGSLIFCFHLTCNSLAVGGRYYGHSDRYPIAIGHAVA